MTGAGRERLSPVENAVARYRSASEANDVDALMAVMTSDVELVSPLSGRMTFRGQADVRVLLTAVYGSLRDLRWIDEVGDERMRVAVADSAIGPLPLTDAMVFDLADDGRIRRIRPHLRPWLGLTALAIRLFPAIARHPGIALRALRSTSS